jgi:hypothetical protein
MQGWLTGHTPPVPTSSHDPSRQHYEHLTRFHGYPDPVSIHLESDDSDPYPMGW